MSPVLKQQVFTTWEELRLVFPVQDSGPSFDVGVQDNAPGFGRWQGTWNGDGRFADEFLDKGHGLPKGCPGDFGMRGRAVIPCCGPTQYSFDLADKLFRRESAMIVIRSSVKEAPLYQFRYQRKPDSLCECQTVKVFAGLAVDPSGVRLKVEEATG